MAKKQFQTIRLSLYPTVAVVVTARNNKGVVGATTIAWNGVASSRPPVISLSFLPDSFTRACLVESRDFVVNVPDGRFWKEMNYLGSLTGPWPFKSDQTPMDIRRLTLVQSAIAQSPRIEEFYLNFECRMLQAVQVGGYDCIFGEVLTMHCDEAAFRSNHRKGNVDHAQMQPILCLGDEYWSGGKFLGISTENKTHPHGLEH